ncbi:MAG: ABC transporter ATP-binding protein [Lachnospiraceae bacterium]
MLELKNISVKMGSGIFRISRKQILSDISFSLSENKALGVIGKSGCGKTTIANVILKLVRYNAGDVILDGKSISTAYNRLELAKKVQLVTQNPETSFDPDLSVGESFREVLKTHKMLRKGVALEDIVYPLMREVGLEDVNLKKLPIYFSGGELQRLSIVRALLVSPRIIIFDEADSMLDTAVRIRLFDTLNELRQKRCLSYIYITHDIRILPYLVENILVIDSGMVVDHGSVERLRTSAVPFIKELRDSMVLEPIERLV